MRNWLALSLAIPLFLAFSGPVRAAAAQPGTELGRNLGGEPCRANSILTQAHPTEFVCGDSQQVLGRLQLITLGAGLPEDRAARRAQIFTRAKAMAVTLSAARELTCDTGQFLGDGAAGDNVLFLCTSKSTNWPQILLVTGVDRTIYQAEGLPSLLPVLSTAIAIATNRPVATEEIAAGEAILAAHLPPALVRLSGADFERFSKAIELSRYYNGARDFVAAEQALRTALDVNTGLFGESSIQVGLTLLELALQVSNQGRFDEAGGLFRRVAPIIQASPSVDARARYNSYLALDAANRRDFAGALAFAREATAERRSAIDAATAASSGGSISTVSAVSSGELAHSLRIEAEMALRLDDLPTAEAAAEEALLIISLEPGLPLWWRPDAVAMMAEINERQGRTTAAERNLLDVIDLRRRLFGNSAPLAIAELRAGKFYVAQQRAAEALPHFRTAIGILAANPAARLLIVSDHLIPFIEAVASVPAGSPERAALDRDVFRAVQLIGTGVADQAIARASVRVAASDPGLTNLIRNMENAQQISDRARLDLSAEFAKPDDERSPARETERRDALMAAGSRTEQLLAEVQQKFPDYTRLAAPGQAELSDLQAQLKPGEAFLDYVVGYRGSYGLLVTPNALTVRRIDTASDALAGDIAALRRALIPQLGRLLPFPLASAHTLYEQLLGPFSGELTGIRHLIVAPGPVLANLPFALLVRAEPARANDYVNAAWLVRSMAVSQVSSPRALVLLRQASALRVAAPRPFLGVGNPQLAGQTETASAQALSALGLACREEGPVPAALLRALPALPDTAAEVNQVARALNGDADSIMLGANATEQNLRMRPLDQYRTLYFATHGLLPGELHCQTEPGLVLSPPAANASGTAADGLLDVSEIAAMKLNADLVVLSACNTAAGGGNSFGGGALQGLADAFFNAGARAVLASHWEVPSAATRQLMTGVFERYGRNDASGIAEALRQSQLALIASPATAHPFNWAAFTLIGGSGGGSPGGGPTARLQTQGDRP